MKLWYIFLIILAALAVALGLRIYVRKKLDSIDGIVGTTKRREIRRAGRKLQILLLAAITGSFCTGGITAFADDVIEYEQVVTTEDAETPAPSEPIPEEPIDPEPEVQEPETEATVMADILVTTIWEDDNDRDGLRTDGSVYLHWSSADRMVNGVTPPETIPAAVADGEQYVLTWTNMVAAQDGRELAYSVAAGEIEGYTTSVSGDAASGFTIRYRHEPERTELSGRIRWEDEKDADGVRPEKVVIHLLANGEEQVSTELTAKDRWRYTFPELYLNEDGAPVEYTVKLDTVSGYQQEADEKDETVTILRHKRQTVDILVSVEWNDADNPVVRRPEQTISLHRILDGEDSVVEQAVADGSEDSQQIEWKRQPGYADGKQVSYKVTADPVTGYQTEIRSAEKNSFHVTNTYAARQSAIVKNILFIVEKILPIREELRALVEAEETPAERPAETPAETSAVAQRTEPRPLETRSIPVRCVWITDGSIAEASSPGSGGDGSGSGGIRVHLLADDQDTGETILLNRENEWTAQFTPPAGESGVVYSVREEVPDGYHAFITGNDAQGFVISNCE